MHEPVNPLRVSRFGWFPVRGLTGRRQSGWRGGCKRLVVHLRVLALLMLGLSVTLGLGGCRDAPEPDDAPSAVPMVRTAPVARAEPFGWWLTGTVRARHESELGFRIFGKIASRLVDVGDRVQAGAPLLRLDDDDLRLAVEEAIAAVEQAEARHENARREAERARRLWPEQSISRQAHDRALADAEEAEAARSRARAALRRAQNRLTYATLRADADGVLVDLPGEPGQVVAAGQTVAVLAQDGPREVAVEVPERRLATLPGTAVAFLPGDDRPLAFTLRTLGASANPDTRSWPARFVAEAPDDSMPLGATVRLDFEPTPADARVVPVSALVVARGSEAAVWVVREVAGEHRVKPHPVKVVRLGRERAWIRTDLPPGTAVVSLGASRLQDGQIVRPIGAVEGS
ncbi:MAG: efflux RND transporter periplasmic adaptor subunit [Halothiobacillaceae bacterium]